MARKTVCTERRVMTPIAMCSFPKLTTPRKQTSDNGTVTDVYEVDLLFEKGTDLTELKKLAEEAKQLQWGDKQPSFVKSGFKKGVQKDEQNPTGYDIKKYPEYAGKIIVTARSYNMAPGVVDHNVQEIIDPNELYGGMLGRATVRACAYDNPKGGCGITFALVNFQKTGEGTRLGRQKVSADDDFEPFQQPAAAGNHTDLFDDDDI